MTDITLILVKDKETKNTVRYKETSSSSHNQDRPHVLYLQKEMLTETFPSVPSSITVTIEDTE